jgi:DNA-binding transcriptional LysR family regulator
MNNRQLESFLTIAQLGSFAAAAERQHVTQSTISARIQELEDDLGVELFDRSQRQVRLTLKGRELMAYAEKVSELFLEIKEQIGSGKSLTGVLRIGVAELVAISWLPTFTSLAKLQYPGIHFEFEVGLNPFLFDGVKSGELDLAVIAGPISDTSFVSKNLGIVHFEWMCSPSLYDGNDHLAANDLRKWPIIYLGTDSFTTQAINAWLGLSNSRKQRGTSCNSLAAVTSLTTAGVGVSLLPVKILADSISRRELRKINTIPAGFDMPFSVIHTKQHSSTMYSSIANLLVEASNFEYKDMD